MTFYLRSIVNMALYLLPFLSYSMSKNVVSRDLEIGVKGHSRYLKVVLLDRLCMVSY